MQLSDVRNRPALAAGAAAAAVAVGAAAYLVAAALLGLWPFSSAAPPSSIQIVLDRSFHMEEPLGDGTKMEAAVRAIDAQVLTEDVAGASDLAFRQYGGPCEGENTELLVGFGRDHRDDVRNALRTVTVGGESTFVNGILQSIRDFADSPASANAHNEIIVVTGGGDTCRLEESEQLIRDEKERLGVEVAITFIGLDVPPEQRDRLNEIAQAISGDLPVYVSSPIELEEQLDRVINRVDALVQDLASGSGGAGGGTPQPTPTPTDTGDATVEPEATATPTPTPTPVPPTDTPVPTDTPEPTPEPPATSTPEPTPTSTPTPTPTPEPEPTATPLPGDDDDDDNTPAANRQPVVSAPLDDVTVEEDAEDTSLDLSEVFSDPDGDPLTLAVESNTDPEPVGASISEDILTLDYQEDQNGTADITLRATDPDGLFAVDTFQVTVEPVNDPPGANALEVTTDENTPVTFTITGSDVETPFEDLEFSVTQGPDNGELASEFPEVTYTPDEGFSGNDSFVFTVTDGSDPHGCGEPGPECDGPADGEADVQITVVPTLEIDPASETVLLGGSIDFDATGGVSPHTFSISTNNSGGSIDSDTGEYIAGSTGGVTDTVTVSDDDGRTADATVDVVSPATTTSLDDGTDTSIAIGDDGLPVVAYYDGSTRDLMVAHCQNVACTEASLSMLDSEGDVGVFLSIAIGDDGLPVISYHDRTNGTLKVAHCLDLGCDNAELNVVDDGASGDFTVGLYTSIAIGIDTLPVISYYDAANDDLKVAHCEDTGCNESTVNTVDSAGDVGLFTSIAIHGEGAPIISYYYQSGQLVSQNLKIAQCFNLDCSSEPAITTVDSDGAVGTLTSIAIDGGLATISYYDLGNGDLKVARCNNLACTDRSVSTVDREGNVGEDSSIAIGLDGLPIISYDDDTNGDLKVAHCNDQECSDATINTVDSGDTVAGFTSIAIGNDGLPVISYSDVIPGLTVAYCHNLTCSNFPNLTLDPAAGQAGDEVRVNGLGFAPGADVTSIVIGGVEVLDAPTPVTDSNGDFSTTVQVPSVPPGDVKVEVTADNQIAAGIFTIQ